MSKKKEPTRTPVKTEPAKPASKTEIVNAPPAAPAKAVEAAKPAPAPTPAPAKVVEAAKPAPAKAAEAAKPVPTPAPTPAKAVEAAKPAPDPAPAKAVEAAKPAPAKVEEKPAAPVKAAPKPAAPAKVAEKPAAHGKEKSTKTTSKAAASKHADSVVTVVVAKYDVGYGNKLYIRGDGAGLNWEAGVLMKNVENDVWVWTTNESIEGPVKFKFLINDEIWCAGEDLSAPAGETTTLSPIF
ncbi:MAG: hypothetical protein QG599_307 [Pseudomonadota bacterium]|nr:hypothetical protein [Pseudomonadota bacterium]